MSKPEWKPDCQGKWDYDADLVMLSCRYWPRGGGYTTFNTATGKVENNNDRPQIPPHACATILFGDDCGDAPIAREDFTGETEEEVKAMVEAWSAYAMSRVEAAIRREFAGKETT